MSRQRVKGARCLERLEEFPVWEPAARRRRPGTHRDRAEVDRRAAAKCLDVAREGILFLIIALDVIKASKFVRKIVLLQ